MKIEIKLKSAAVCQLAGIKPATLDYAVRQRIIPEKLVTQRGSGFPRLYDPKVVEILKDWRGTDND